MIFVYDDSGNKIDYGQYGLTCYSFIPESLSPRFSSEEIENVDGSILLGTTINARKLYVEFLFNAKDHIDYQLLRDEIFKFFNPKKDLYIIDTRLPGKRWKARNSTTFKPEYLTPTVGGFGLEFIAFGVYAESIGSSLDPKTFDVEKWQIGQGLTDDNNKYIHSTNSFSIFNAGEIAINPRKRPVVITFKGASTNLQIKNKTTGDTWTYTGSSNPSDVIKLDGIRSTKNGLSIFRDTNHKLITLATGNNDFQLTGTSGSFEISFDFRFYYV
ncbi:phage tail family protein [Neobacillus massiliamazoniensis]|uniref:Phage-like protein n=1 Tax=Neobacillus massiliamazoniensis TaxID=1499688 RepID=A0A0U1NQH7_9BACI|nr:phage tail family protein [Neobacillus massiliamazoniensis]CRK80301.1 phage-like protein [Neobacillus massiliamazoniensis]